MKWAAPKLTWCAKRWDFATLHVVAGSLTALSGDKEGTAFHLGAAVERFPSMARLCVLHARALRWQGRLWMQLEALESAAHRFAADHAYLLTLGRVQLEMNRLDAARATLVRAIGLRPQSAAAYWYLGQALEQLGLQTDAAQAYQHAEAFGGDKATARYGVGWLFEQAGLWPQAAQQYVRRLPLRPHDVPVRMRLARMHEHLLEWAQAAAVYREVLQGPRAPAAAGRSLAWALARVADQAAPKEDTDPLCAWAEVEHACQHALSARCTWPSIRRDMHWLLAWSQSAQGRHAQAVQSFLKASPAGQLQWVSLRAVLLPHAAGAAAHAKRVEPSFAAARQAWRMRDWTTLAQCLAAAIARWPHHAPRLYALHGYALAQCGAYDSACAAFLQSRRYRWPQAAAQLRHPPKKALRQVMEYSEYLERMPLDRQVVLYESYAGVSVSCNPYAIFLAVVDDPAYAAWIHVWVLNDLSRMPPVCADRRNVVFVVRDSQLYQRYLATAGWLINNSTFPSYFIRRDGQQYLNTWHGTPLKTLGKDIRGNFMEHKNTARNLLQASHIISPNPHTSQVLLERNDIAGLFQGQLAETGYPRNDRVLNVSAAQKRAYRQQLGLPAQGRPVLLYAPTWRGILGHPEVDSQQLLADLAALQHLPCDIVFRGHYFAEQALAKAGLPGVRVAPQAMDTAELLAMTDILVTDYSSIFFDFLPTGRPIVFYAYDLAQYEQARGLYFTMQSLPGPLCEDAAQLVQTLSSTLQLVAASRWQPGSAYHDAVRKFCPAEDGKATQRAISFFFEAKGEIALSSNKDVRQTLLFFAGAFAPMGITTAATNLIAALDPARYRIVLAIDPAAIESQVERRERLARLPAHVQVIGRVGRQVCTAQERRTIDAFHRHDALSTPQWAVYEVAYEREFRRMFGTWAPDHVINYDGYARFWAGLFACGPRQEAGRVIYLHNDMAGEWKMKFPRLAGMFALYPRYDQLVSVASAIAEKNRVALSERFGIAPQRFTYADNVPDFAAVQSMAAAPLEADLAQLLQGVPPGQAFLSIGRLSPEKNHALLLDAFALLQPDCPDARLFIVGDGPLHAALKVQVKTLGLEHAVHLVGLRSNPFPLMARCDCFVLPSLHEGQPMVLLEALALHKAIIATDIPGVRELLIDGYGTLVPIDPMAMSCAMRNHSEGWGRTRKYLNMNAYKNTVVEKFETNLQNGMNHRQYRLLASK